MHFDKEYFLNSYYFFMKERKNHIDLYFSINNTLTEARKNDEIIKFKKENKKEFEKLIKDLIKDKKPKTQSELKKKFDFSCINLSVGYHSYHTKNEYVVVEEVLAGLKSGLLLIQELGNKKYKYVNEKFVL